MTVEKIYDELGYENLYNVRKGAKSEFEEFKRLGIDKVHFSGDFPAIFFKEVGQFNNTVLTEIAQLHHSIWNYRKVIFLFVLSPTQIRIYNCNKKPFNYEDDAINTVEELAKLEIIDTDVSDVAVFRLVKELFSRVAVDCGTLWNTENPLREKIDIQQRIDRYLVKSLLTAAKELKALELSDDIIHSLLMRSIFIMYLEDKGAAKDTILYTRILKEAESYIDILQDANATYTLFQSLEEHFNGNVFPILKGEKQIVTSDHLQIVKKCLVDGDLSENPKLFTWRLFKFDIIQIELLSEIYENFLEEFKEFTKQSAGQYYTPPSLVELVLNQKLKTQNEVNWKVKILDPACGSGIFLVESFKRLVQRWKNAHPEEQIEFKDLREILEKNIFGIEYDRLAIRVAAFSLYLGIVEQLNPKTLWVDKRYRFPYLINDPTDETIKIQGTNLFRADTIGDIKTENFNHFDLVVGNPPFGSKIGLASIQKFCTDRRFGQDMVIPFLCKAIDFAEKGEVALIFNTKVLTNTEKPFQNFRSWLFKETYVEKIFNFSIFRKTPKSFGGQLFTSAVGPVSILFYKKNPPEKKSEHIEYWAPKTYVKNTLVEGVVIDASDIKFLPREECQKPDTKIWKIAMWGSLEDFHLITRLNELPNFKTFIKQNKIPKGLGLQFLDRSTKKIKYNDEIPKLKYVHPGNLDRYYTSARKFSKLTEGLTEKSEKIYKSLYQLAESSPLQKINAFRREGAFKAFQGPHVLVKEGLSKNKICASYIEEACSFNSKVLGFSGVSKDILGFIASLINSDISTYYLFLISASIGIEREEIKPNEIYELPFVFHPDIAAEIILKLNEIKKVVDANYPMSISTASFEKQINEIIMDKVFTLSDNDKILIDDFMKYPVELMFKGYKSVALKPTDYNENKAYASLLSKELNSFLESELYATVHWCAPNKYHPLIIAKIDLGRKQKTAKEFNLDALQIYLTEIDKHLLKKEAKSIYIKRQVQISFGNIIYIVKPNQKRFWTQSMAICDAKDIIGNILKMK